MALTRIQRLLRYFATWRLQFNKDNKWFLVITSMDTIWNKSIFIKILLSGVAIGLLSHKFSHKFYTVRCASWHLSV